MDLDEMASSILNIAQIGSRIVSGLYSLADTWTSAPQEVHYLRDTVALFCRLLESAAAVHAGRAHVDKTPTQGLYHELKTAESVLRQLKGILNRVRAPHSLDASESPLQGSVKARWASERDNATRLRTEVNDIHQRILAQLAVRNISVSADVPISSSRVPPALSTTSRSQHIPPNLRERKPPRPQEIAIISSISQIPQDAPSQTRASANHDVNAKSIIQFQEQKTRMNWREFQNECTFQHLERVFTGMSTTFNSHQTGPQGINHLPPALASSHISRLACAPGCSCKCHSSRSYTIWTLSAFKSTLGAFSFQFTGRLAPLLGSSRAGYDASCLADHTKTRGVIYTFPTWLLHAAISATFSDRTGTPELLLRVLRRIAPDPFTMNASLFRSIWRRDVDGARMMLQRGQGSIYDVRGDDGRSVLVTALQTRNFEIAVLLLQKGADLFQPDDNGNAPFHEVVHIMYAATNISFASRRMLEDVLPLDLVINRAGLSDLHKVVTGIRPLNIREYLSYSARQEDIDAQDTTGRTPLYYASARGDTFAARALLEAGASPLIYSSPAHLTPLHIACRSGHYEIVNMLLEAGADVNARNIMMVTPLHAVCEMGTAWNDQNKLVGDDRTTIVAQLILHGADINAVDRDKSTAVDLASLHNQGALVDYLIEVGVDMNHRDWEGCNSLGNAIVLNGCSSAAVLLRRGVDHRNIDDNGLSILHYAAMNANLEMMELLVAQGAGLTGLDVELRNKEGKTPMDVFNGRTDASDQLKETFQWLLDTVSQARSLVDSDNESEAGEFFDARED